MTTATTTAAPADHRPDHHQAAARPVGSCPDAPRTPGFCPFVNRLQKAECYRRLQGYRRPVRREIR